VECTDNLLGNLTHRILQCQAFGPDSGFNVSPQLSGETPITLDF